jgi:hypothetical protein
LIGLVLATELGGESVLAAGQEASGLSNTAGGNRKGAIAERRTASMGGDGRGWKRGGSLLSLAIIVAVILIVIIVVALVSGVLVAVLVIGLAVVATRSGASARSLFESS